MMDYSILNAGKGVSGNYSALEIIRSCMLPLFVWYCLILLYRLTFHPLSRYPGRLSERLSDWPIVYYCIKGNRHIKQLLAHEKYGPIVRDGPNSLSFRSPEALKAIYGNNAHIKKGDWYLTLDISAGAPSVQMVIDQHQHALRRRVMSPAFSEKALRDAEPLINTTARKLCERLAEALSCTKDEWSKGFDLQVWIAYYGYDFISDLAFGRSLELLDREEHRFVPPTLRSASQFLYYVGYLPFAALVRPLMGTSVQDYFPGQSARDSLKYTDLANSRLAERIEREKKRKEGGGGAERKDTFHYLLNSRDPVTGKEFTVEELQADTSLLIAAGSDGVTLASCALLFYALQQPHILRKLINEIREAFPTVEDIRTPKLNGLLYLHACIEESLRMAPPKPGSLPRIVLPGGTEIDGQHIPAGTTVGVSHYVIHRNADVFPEPNMFRPERWIVGDGNSAEQLAAQKRAFCPFGIGPMNCIGRNTAYLAIKLALAHLFWQFDFRVHGDLIGGGSKKMEEGRRDETEYQMYDWIIGFPSGPIVQVRSRV
ncbi:benzoate 4-monooxygenase cytochrome P450 [Lindgomyces ingoldianus]|uniref:Benzoate 4-monooxygenase cytochrome P450 n=1 Tax=Lindgomyces ingoldianus TaxID=673940 RepID=A0ACB6QQ61_9PLEO|nr:benzoate 4-monooxygenase cytochrome P450 [Lindgomyces ingoldianus]KAF2468670.1 benzoate 4-monooxygenase cytochrome P450 [Lindgomyces ingoldianus]